MILTHFSHKPFTLNRDEKYDVVGWNPLKPDGLWLSDESDRGWKDWCEGCDFQMENLAHRADFEIDLSNILHIPTREALYQFHKDFRGKGEMNLSLIDWARVKSKYGGIIVTPYQSTLHLAVDFLWYYGWDCASGCVWDLSALSSQ